MTNGWIKLQRGLLEHGIFQDSDLLRVWVYCLLQASYRTVQLPIGRQVIQLQPGQLLFGRKAFSQRLQMSEGQLRHVMQQLVDFGSIAVMATNRYSIVTIVNWTVYQQEKGQPSFPFDCDFLEEDLADDVDDLSENCLELQPTVSQLENQSPDGLESCGEFEIADLQPTVSHKQKEKNYKNKIQEKNEKSIKNKRKEQRIKTEKNRQEEKQKIRKMNQEEIKQKEKKQTDMDKSKKDNGKSRIHTGKLSSTEIDANQAGMTQLNRAEMKLTENNLEQPCRLPLQNKIEGEKQERAVNLEPQRQDNNGQSAIILSFSDCDADVETKQRTMDSNILHVYQMEMAKPDTALNTADVWQLEQLFLQQKTGQGYGATDPRTAAELVEVYNTKWAKVQPAETMVLSNQDTVFVKRRQDQVQLQQAQALFERLWSQYPVQIGRHKVSDKQILAIAAQGEPAMEIAIRNYSRIKQGCAKQYWMHGSTFFHGGYLDYLPQAQKINETEILWEGLV